ncbi:putative TIR domain, P-loop containing nucleoside triphosphate hydrolase [Helianthus debilis subsp. tardiflorus]
MAVELVETLKEAYTGLSPNTIFTVLAAGIAVYYMVSVFFRGSSHHHQQHSPTSSEEEAQIRSTASSTSSSHLSPASSSQSWNHDVFLSFRGEDTRKGFVDHLYKALVQQGIQTYKDDETLARGERIGPALLKAIQESRIAVIVFSANYADSSWCLDELAHIIECMDNRGQIVEPIFYHVDPSDVRKQKGKYGEAIAKHKRQNKHKVDSWRQALEKAGNLSGWVINDIVNSYEAKCIKEIVGTIFGRLPPPFTNVNKDLIGIETRLQALKSKLEIGSNGVRIVGIWGVGGGGKTTVASAAYAEISHLFEAHCLLQNIREESNKHGLEKLQEKFLSLVLKTKDVVVGSEIEGRSMIERRLCRKCILLVLDDVDDVKQLEALAGSHAWFGEGSRIIITTRDEHLLTRHADTIYEVSLLSNDEAMKLFSKHAYRKDKPIEDYEMLSEAIVSYAGGLPLALEILGSFLYDKNKDEWKSALAKLKDIPDDKVTRRLKISYDGLEPYQQKLFLDIACFMKGWLTDKAMTVLDACSFHPGIGVKVLIQKSLVKVSNGKFDMHDLVEEMAHYIVRGEHPDHPEKHSRVWKKEDIEELCAIGPAAVLMETEVLALSRYVKHPGLGLSDVIANMKKLRWITCEEYLASSFPSSFQPTKLGCLMLRVCTLKQLWEGYKHLPNLRLLILSSAFNLTKTPDFDGLPCLERLILEGCSSLEEIHPSIGFHESLVFVNMESCSKLKAFPPIICMKKLETLNLSHCRQLEKFPDIQAKMDSLVNLYLDHTNIEIIPASVGQFCTNLVSFDLCECKNLKRIEGSFLLLKSLKDLHLYKCSKLQCQHFLQDNPVSLKLPQFPWCLMKLNLSFCNLGDEDIPPNIWELLHLQVLDLSNNQFSRLHSGLSRFPCLKFLNLSRCTKLVHLPELPLSIAILDALGCDSLESIVDLSNYKWLWKVSFQRWKKFLIGGDRVVRSMVQGNAVEDRFMSIQLSNAPLSNPRSHMNLITLQLPHNWYCDFTGFLLCADFVDAGGCTIVMKQDMLPRDSQVDHDYLEEFDKMSASNEYAHMGYVPFSSLRQTSWWNPTYSNLKFQIQGAAHLKVGLVPMKSKSGESRESAIDCSECWEEAGRHRKTFEIIDE